MATVLRISNDRSVRGIRGAARRPATRGRRCATCGQRVSTPEQARCQRLYVEAAALGVLGTEPFASVVAEANDVWLGALADHLVASGDPCC